RLTGAAGMLFLFTLAIPVQAAEQDELATAMRQLDHVQAALERARTASLQASPQDERYFFDYRRARADLQTIRDGIDRYLAPSRAQPRSSAAVTGDYRRERP
ncbi:integrative conjugative element protein, RAQPRD family, partial [Escherichia coli]|uniref:integrative conjugative element protein, RAQPRD family n=1 Tax=Escherichia coli TaxID=562 RepID=UPI0035B511F6